jgi:hypothetical protein
MMQLHCKGCGKQILADDVNIKLAIAKCQACHAVFNFANEVGGATETKPEVALPKRFQVDAWGRELTITRRWYSHGVWFLVFFCTIWDGFLIFWYSMAVSSIVSDKYAGMGSGFAWIALVFPILHLAVGVGLTYLVICTFLNKTVVRVSSGELSVRHGPVPFPGNKTVLTSDLKQLFCTEKMHRGKHGCRYTYNVELLKSDNSKVKLLTSLEELDQALFIEQQIEKHLQIADERIPGEVRM